MALESMRRGFVGGSMLSLFIIKEFGLEGQAVPTLNALRGYLDREEALLAQIPPIISFIFTPFNDYHQASKTCVEIIDILAEMQQHRECTKYWKKGES